MWKIADIIPWGKPPHTDPGVLLEWAINLGESLTPEGMRENFYLNADGRIWKAVPTSWGKSSWKLRVFCVNDRGVPEMDVWRADKYTPVGIRVYD